MFVVGERVTLRAMDAGDGEALWRWNHDPEVMRWMNTRYPQSRDRVTRWLDERARNDYAEALFGIETHADRTLIGLVQLHDAEPEVGTAKLDVYLGEKDHWGKGYATDAVRTACRFGFAEMRLHRIALTVVTENHAAVAVYRKVGFVEEGRLRQSFRREGRWYDQLTMALLEGELS
ncbi:GNAT family N-acetyltransferase [Micromonospora sp. NPDC000089]|uniref:GNAT family N-acetyltransferase n=1 Tax=unclassified Micromonospora TaxID=2617518 RepID=UPI0036CBCDA8